MRVAFAVLVVSFAILVTTHVTLAFGLARRAPAGKALLAFVVAPLAPWWGWRAHMRVRGLLWMAASAVYVVALALCMRG